MQPQDVEAQVPASPTKAEQAEERSMETFFKEVAAIKVCAGVGAPRNRVHVQETARPGFALDARGPVPVRRGACPRGPPPMHSLPPPKTRKQYRRR